MSSFIILYQTLGKTYCSGGGPGTLVGVARIECKVKSVSGNTAELEYTAYYPNFDELPQEEVDVHEVYTIGKLLRQYFDCAAFGVNA